MNRLLRSHLLLLIEPSLFQDGTAREMVLCLPGGNTDVGKATGIGEDRLHLFQSLAGGLGEHEVDVKAHGGTENTEENVDLPLDVDERRGHKIAKGKVEGPVGGSAEGICLATNTKGEQLRRVDPADGTPANGVGPSLMLALGRVCSSGEERLVVDLHHEEISGSNNSLASRSCNQPGLCLNAIKTARRGGMPVCGHQTSIGVHPGHHCQGTGD